MRTDDQENDTLSGEVRLVSTVDPNKGTKKVTNEAENKIMIDEVEYDLSQLSEEAKAQIVNIRFTDSLITRLKAELAVANTARAGYSEALKSLL